MPRIADYAVVSDGSFTLENNGDNRIFNNIDLESGTHTGSRAVLMYVLFIDAGEQPVTYRVTINGQSQINHSLNGVRVATLHEVINSNVLNLNNNTIEFEITNGNPGALQFSDVVLMYQRNV